MLLECHVAELDHSLMGNREPFNVVEQGGAIINTPSRKVNQTVWRPGVGRRRGWRDK